ncbi:hypothetical protein DFS34DRAFT_205457 [Phlyctochytrium arcticum]|nr:hypothetical protein DFS34DRAFT_205457 [Phlyctochytrium arcticum]
MFNRIGKAVEASRDAIGTLQTTLKEQGIDPVSFSARLRASSTASLPPVAGNRQQLDMGIDEDGDNDGFSQQSLMGSSAADTRNGIANEGSVAATSGNSEPSAGGADLMRFSEESNGAGLADASPRQSLERKGPNEAPEDSRGGDSLQMPATAASNENSSSVLSPSVPSSLSQPLLPITASAAASPAPSISPIPPPRPAPVQQTASDDSSTFAPQSQPALSSMNAEDVLRMDVSEMTERLARLRRFEAKFSGGFIASWIPGWLVINVWASFRCCKTL